MRTHPLYSMAGRAVERRAMKELMYEIRRRRREREAADLARRRRARVELLEFMSATRRRRRAMETASDRQRRYVRGLTTGLEESIGAGRLGSLSI